MMIESNGVIVTGLDGMSICYGLADSFRRSPEGTLEVLAGGEPVALYNLGQWRTARHATDFDYPGEDPKND